jgi:hypothetical protein
MRSWLDVDIGDIFSVIISNSLNPLSCKGIMGSALMYPPYMQVVWTKEVRIKEHGLHYLFI